MNLPVPATTFNVMELPITVPGLPLANTNERTIDGGSTVAPPGQGAQAPVQGGPPPGGGAESLVMIGLMLVVFYFLLIRPNQKRAKKHKELVDSLKRGDTVITSSGIFGRITQIDGNTVSLEIAKNTKIKLLRSYVSGIANPDTEKELAAGPRP